MLNLHVHILCLVGLTIIADRMINPSKDYSFDGNLELSKDFV